MIWAPPALANSSISRCSTASHAAPSKSVYSQGPCWASLQSLSVRIFAVAHCFHFRRSLPGSSPSPENRFRDRSSEDMADQGLRVRLRYQWQFSRGALPRATLRLIRLFCTSLCRNGPLSVKTWWPLWSEALKLQKYTLPETNIAMENPPFWWYLPGKMGIFMGYVSFREGNLYFSCWNPCNCSIWWRYKCEQVRIHTYIQH